MKEDRVIESEVEWESMVIKSKVDLEGMRKDFCD